MVIVRMVILIYASLSCIACVIHMWRNRKEREIVKVYAWTFLLELFFVLVYGVWWDSLKI